VGEREPDHPAGAADQRSRPPSGETRTQHGPPGRRSSRQPLACPGWLVFALMLRSLLPKTTLGFTKTVRRAPRAPGAADRVGLTG